MSIGCVLCSPHEFLISTERCLSIKLSQKGGDWRCRVQSISWWRSERWWISV